MAGFYSAVDTHTGVLEVQARRYNNLYVQILRLQDRRVFKRVATAAAGPWDAWGITEGDVTGPASAVDRQIASFNGTTGKQLRAISIVGTVSQSSGVPTGALMERGSNANGTYERFADGTQICIMTRDVAGSGAGVRTFDLTYPASFSASPILLGGARNWGGSFRFLGPTTATLAGTASASSVGIDVTQAGAGAVGVVIRAEGVWF